MTRAFIAFCIVLAIGPAITAHAALAPLRDSVERLKTNAEKQTVKTPCTRLRTVIVLLRLPDGMVFPVTRAVPC